MYVELEFTAMAYYVAWYSERKGAWEGRGEREGGGRGENREVMAVLLVCMTEL